MNILIVSAHPAQVHGFRNLREQLIRDGHTVFWATTKKDIAIDLLEQYGIDYFLIEKAPKSFFGRVRSMLRNLWRLIPYLRRNKIDMVVDRYEPFVTVAAWLTRTPHICEADTEHAAIKCAPFIKMCNAALYPECFYEKIGNDMIYFPGNIEIYYLHPNRFTPSPVWDLLGIEPDTRFAIVRFVKWDAWHDTHLVGGFTLDQKRELIARLSKHLRVFISSESELPSDLEPYRIHIPIQRMHDVQAAAALFVGESATMASESVVLGTPSIYIDEVGRGYTDEEARQGLLWMFRPVANRNSLIIEDQKNAAQQKSVSLSKKENGKVEPWWISGGVEECIAKAEEIADAKFDAASYAKRHQAWMATKIDCTAFLTWFIENYPSSVSETRKADAGFWERFK